MFVVFLNTKKKKKRNRSLKTFLKSLKFRSEAFYVNKNKQKQNDYKKHDTQKKKEVDVVKSLNSFIIRIFCFLFFLFYLFIHALFLFFLISYVKIKIFLSISVYKHVCKISLFFFFSLKRKSTELSTIRVICPRFIQISHEATCAINISLLIHNPLTDARHLRSVSERFTANTINNVLISYLHTQR